MKATDEQIFNAAITLLAGSLAGDQSASTAHSRLTITGPQHVQDAIDLAKKVAEAV